MTDHVQNALLALLLTIIIEVIVAFAIGLRDRLSLLAVVFINLITNPAFNFILLIISLQNWRSPYHLYEGRIIIVLEIFIVFLEWLLLVYVLGKKHSKKYLLGASVLMNGISLFVGSFLLAFLLTLFRL